MGEVWVLGRDEIGTVAESREAGRRFRYYLTDCCGASATGTEWGTACRACYEEVDPALGLVPGMDLGPDGSWSELPLRLVEAYGDGIPYEEWKATVFLDEGRRVR